MSDNKRYKKYEVNTRIKGYIYAESEDDAFECDPGDLHNIDVTPLDEPNCYTVEGTYTFIVVAKNKADALRHADDVFTDIWEQDGIDCGDIEDTDQTDYTDGKKETYRISDCLGFADEDENEDEDDE